jgi:hypothetical protein
MAFNFGVGSRGGPLSSLESLETNDGKTTAANSIDFYDGVKSSPVHVSFPNDLEQIDHWITFRAFETKQMSRRAAVDKNALAFIALPVPSNLSAGYEIGYTEFSLGAIGKEIVDAVNNDEKSKQLVASLGVGAAAGAAVAAMTGQSLLAGATAGTIGAGAIKILNGNKEATALAAAVGAQALGDLGGAITGQLGVARNPHKVVLFEGVGFRKHQFTYTFVPQSRAETDKIRTIISLFKFFGSPSLNASGTLKLGQLTNNTIGDITISGGKHFFKYPEYFEMDFHHPKYLFQIGPSVLENIEVKYGGEQQYYARGITDKIPSPTQITLSLTFKETEIITKENIFSENR